MSPEPRQPRQSPAVRPFVWVLLAVALVVAALCLQWHGRIQARPLTYRIGSVDERFGMTREAFSGAVADATGIWRQAVPRDLFREAPDGDLEVNLVYDYRQESVDRLKTLSLKIDESQGSYESLKAHFETLKGESEQKGASLAQDFAAYNTRVAAFNAQGEAARRVPVSEGDHRRLEAERRELAEMMTALMRRQDELKTTAETLNSLAQVVNGIAANHNVNLVDYRQTGDQLGPEFFQGEYVRKGGRRAITIFHFSSRDGLVRVLAHELGHAKGLPHLENPKALMHPFMRTDFLELAPEDIQAMKAKVGNP